MIKEFSFKQFNLALVICLHTVYTSNSSIQPIDRIPPGTTSPGSNGIEKLLHIP